ncbi:hypothetical protein KP509_02G038200 [Ceratopteris richardii]|uniref:Glycerol-3-phosphate acyltransferase RAM2/GPAT1-8 HAD-like domain-containing protein n=1 Tax=Ceratopteris richardii TaxID=49495 RepID=A0A8T2VC12_CERRI|nr:hypothetical protein KP509_02G038200 [Ceratopteris richardii]
MERSATQVATELEGWLLRDMGPFPYFFLVAMEAGSLIFAIAVLLAFPIAATSVASKPAQATNS